MAKRELRLARLLKRLAKFRPLILDDIGYVQQDREEMEVLFTLLAERYERGSIILTSNLPFSKWEKIFKDPMTTAAAIFARAILESRQRCELSTRAIEEERRERPRRQKTGKRNDPPQEFAAGDPFPAWSIPLVPPFCITSVGWRGFAPGPRLRERTRRLRIFSPGSAPGGYVLEWSEQTLC